MSDTWPDIAIELRRREQAMSGVGCLLHAQFRRAKTKARLKVVSAVAVAVALGFIYPSNAAPPVKLDRTACTASGTIANSRAASGSQVNVRSGPGRQYAPAGKIKVGDTVQICTTSNSWTGVHYGNGRTGWISSSFVSSAPTKTSTPSSLKVSADPSQPHETARRTSEWASAFSRRTYKLGMTLSQFRATPYPDQATTPGVFPVCTGDATVSQGDYSDTKLFSIAYEKAGLTKCAFYRKLEVSENFALPISTGLTLDDNAVSTVFYFMAPAPGEEPVLFWIQTKGPAAEFDGLVPALQKEYGSPGTKSTQAWPSASGTKIDNPVLVWKNNVSRVHFKRYGNTLDVFELEHTLTPVMDELNRKLGLRSVAAASRP